MEMVIPEQLASLLSSQSRPLLLDVRLADDYEASRIPGSVNNCVLEVAFHDRLPELAPDKTQSIVIYGASQNSAEARMAAEKLERSGYHKVAILEGGLDTWLHENHPVEKGQPIPQDSEPPHGQLDLDLDECRLEWIGRNLINQHHGTVEITSGHLIFDQGELTGGVIDFDFKTLRCADLEGTELHDMLIRHLHDHDFLDVEKHPEGRLSILSAVPVSGSTPGSPNLHVNANLTMRGVTQPIEFMASSGPGPNGNPAAQAVFSVDRTRWDIIYGSGRFFDRLAGHLVNDLIEFQVRILTK